MVDYIRRISDYLGCQPDQEVVTRPDVVKYFHFEGGGLKYELYVNLEENLIQISGDFAFPFAADSLFEITATFDRITVETEPHCYGDQKILVCRKDYPDRPNFKTLMIIKWPNSKLSVWPSLCVWDVPKSMG